MLHSHLLGRVVIVDPATIEEEGKGRDGDPPPLAVGLHEFAHLGGLLYPKADLVRVLTHHLQVDALGIKGLGGLPCPPPALLQLQVLQQDKDLPADAAPRQPRLLHLHLQ